MLTENVLQEIARRSGVKISRERWGRKLDVHLRSELEQRAVHHEVRVLLDPDKIELPASGVSLPGFVPERVCEVIGVLEDAKIEELAHTEGVLEIAIGWPKFPTQSS